MGSLFRSEDMTLLRLYFERGAAHATVDELGKLGLVQFTDLNPQQSAFQRAFSANVRLCDDMQRRIRYLFDQIESDDALPTPDLRALVYDYDDRSSKLRLDDLDGVLATHESNLLQINSNLDMLDRQRSELVELRYVLEKGSFFFKTAPRVQQASYGTMGYLDSNLDSNPIYSQGVTPPPLFADEAPKADQPAPTLPPGSGALLSYFAGVVDKTKISAFERVLFRATRGNCFVRFSEIPEELYDPTVGYAVHKSAFMVFFSGSQVKAKVSKICSAFGANLYDFPDNTDNQTRMLEECLSRLSDLHTVIETSRKERQTLLSEVAEVMPLWDEKIRREKAIYHVLNMLNYDTSNALFIADVWAPSFALEDVRTALNAGRHRSQAQVPSILEERPIRKETPPTYFRTNRFTSVFQGIVESYGVAEYKEVNPAPFAVITFPFLFAVMFGDVGHGILMFVFSLWVVLNEHRMVRRTLGEFMQTCYDGRYMLLLMGFFSIFTGFIYNEFFSIPLDIFGTRWEFKEESKMACGIDNCDIPAAVRAPIKPYPLGFDPIWKGSSNGLLYFNSYKMKLSIVLGVIQMILGICMSYLNAKQFKQPLDVWYVFVPQMIFMNAIFGYLVFIIILKWATNWDAPSCTSDPNCVPPDLKTVLIGMFMAPGQMSAEGQLYTGQNTVQVVLLLLALIAVPWMLFPKPLILRARHAAREAYRPLVDENEGTELLGNRPDGGEAGADGGAQTSGGGGSGHDDDEEEFNFANIFVNQMIHTIEFVLGAVSNTASYLRLWALSLAHAELSDVFMEKLMYMTIESGSTILMIMGFFMWVGLTIGVLMFMESLSAFLHALRLHWVEFQNKFYNLHGSGAKFIAFDYEALREVEE